MFCENCGANLAEEGVYEVCDSTSYHVYLFDFGYDESETEYGDFLRYECIGCNHKVTRDQERKIRDHIKEHN